MIAVIDTNVAFTMFKTKHPTRPIFDAWAAGVFHWAVSTEILLELEEVAARMASVSYANVVLQTMFAVATARDNLIRVSPSFRFHLITGDADDDKFADCAIAAGADYIITADRHFDSLINSGYKPQPISPAEFIRRCLAAKQP